MVTISELWRGHIAAMAELTRRNREDIESTGPARDAAWYLDEAQAARFEAILSECTGGRVRFWAIETDGGVVGNIGLQSIERGIAQSANVGYLVDRGHRGRGVASEALRLVVTEAFGALHLHRLEAGALTTNVASHRVLEKAGFTRIGICSRHLYVGGAWRDHVLYELVGADFVPSGG